MKCKFCGTNHNLHSCPNCGAAAHEEPKPEPVVQQPAPTPPPAPAPSARSHNRAVRLRLITAVVLMLVLSATVSRIVAPRSSSTSSSSSSSRPASAAVQEYPTTGTDAFRTLDEATYRDSAALLDFEAVNRAPEGYVGQDLYVIMEIAQATESSEGVPIYLGYTMYPDGRIDTDMGTRSKTRTVVYDYSGGDARYYAKEYLVVWGDFAGVQSIRLSMGSQNMPVLYGRYMELTETPELYLPDGGVGTGLLGTEAFRTLDEAQYKAQAEFMDYQAVLRTPGRYTQQDLRLVMQISQVKEDERGRPVYIGYTMFPDGTFDGDSGTRGATRSQVIDMSGTEQRFYEKEYLVVWGDFLEIWAAESLVGNYDIPVLQGRYLERTGEPGAYGPGVS